MPFDAISTSQFLSGLIVPVSIVMLILLGRKQPTDDATARRHQKRAA